jgi:hypothetical protein
VVNRLYNNVVLVFLLISVKYIPYNSTERVISRKTGKIKNILPLFFLFNNEKKLRSKLKNIGYIETGNFIIL